MLFEADEYHTSVDEKIICRQQGIRELLDSQTVHWTFASDMAISMWPHEDISWRPSLQTRDWYSDCVPYEPCTAFGLFASRVVDWTWIHHMGPPPVKMTFEQSCRYVREIAFTAERFLALEADAQKIVPIRILGDEYVPHIICKLSIPSILRIFLPDKMLTTHSFPRLRSLLLHTPLPQLNIVSIYHFAYDPTAGNDSTDHRFEEEYHLSESLIEMAYTMFETIHKYVKFGLKHPNLTLAKSKRRNDRLTRVIAEGFKGLGHEIHLEWKTGIEPYDRQSEETE